MIEDVALPGLEANDHPRCPASKSLGKLRMQLKIGVIVWKHFCKDHFSFDFKSAVYKISGDTQYQYQSDQPVARQEPTEAI
ncbi:MAG: hypothetical protein HKP58_04420 [Desulfatitalea sp.]|nr:hypothetical protein [Desulfatitalea sp.]